MEDAAAIRELVAWLRAALAAHPGTFLLGITGPPGSGKSTLAARLLAELAIPRSATVSLDDFYLDPEERRARGLRFRGPPGTHDLALIEDFLAAMKREGSFAFLPRYDREHERRLPAERVAGPLRLCIVEGWFLGARAPGYEGLAAALDRLIYLDLDPALARAARLAREAAFRAAGRGGMSDTAVAEFFDTALAPHFRELVLPLKERADVVIGIDAAHHITGLRFQSPPRSTAS